MQRKLFDAKHFKHVSSDDKKTILRHADGHELTIAHSKLSKPMQEQLKALAGSDREMPKEEPKPQMLAEGPIVEDPNQVGKELPAKEPVSQVTEQDPSLARKRDLYNRITSTAAPVIGDPNMGVSLGEDEQFGPQGQEPKMFNKDAWAKAEQAYQKEVSQNADQAAALQQNTVQDNQARVAAGLQPLQVPNIPQSGPMIPGSQPGEIAPEQSVSGHELAQAGLTTPDGIAKPQAPQTAEGMFQSGLHSQMAGIQGQAQAQSELGAANQAAIEKNLAAKTAAEAEYQKHFDNLEQERQAFTQAIQDNEIRPDQYWTGGKNGEGSHSKIASAIGIILAGFNPTSQPNAAIKMLQYQMDKSMEAQVHNLGKQKTLLEANLRQFGNLKDATEMTRLMMNDAAQQELQLAAAKSQSPMAKAAAQQAIGQLQMQAAPQAQQFAMQRAMMGLAQNGSDPASIDHMLGYMRVINPQMAKSMEERYVPGVGLASVPVTPEIRKQLVAHNNFSAAINDLNKFIKTHTTLVPGTKDYIAGEQKAQALKTVIREQLLNTVYREGEKPLLDKMLNSNPAGIMKYATSVQLKELQKMTDRDFNNVKQSVGLKATPTAEQSNSPEAAAAWAKANPGPKADAILKLLGKK